MRFLKFACTPFGNAVNQRVLGSSPRGGAQLKAPEFKILELSNFYCKAHSLFQLTFFESMFLKWAQSELC